MNITKIIKNLLFIIVIVSISYGIIIKLKENKEITEKKVYVYKKDEPINVETTKLKLETINDFFSFSGAFEPNKETKISAEQQGKITNIYADLGDYVYKGQELIKLDQTLLNEQLNTINVQIQNSKVESNIQLNANQIQIDNLKKDLVRYTNLTKADAIQSIQLEKVEQQLKVLENQRLSIIQQSNLKNAEAQKRSILEQINKTTIKAPFNGIITAKLTEVGSFAGLGVQLLQISDISYLRFLIYIPETDLKNFKLGKFYNIKVDSFPNIKIYGKLIIIGSKANAGNSFPLYFAVKNTNSNSIKAGMFGKVLINNIIEKKSIIIPANVLLGNSDNPQVYVVKNGKAKLTNVTISRRKEDKLIISDGLNDKDIIVTNGFINLFDGANILVKQN